MYCFTISSLRSLIYFIMGHHLHTWKSTLQLLAHCSQASSYPGGPTQNLNHFPEALGVVQMVFYGVQVRSNTELLSTPSSNPKINLMELERNIKKYPDVNRHETVRNSWKDWGLFWIVDWRDDGPSPGHSAVTTVVICRPSGPSVGSESIPM